MYRIFRFLKKGIPKKWVIKNEIKFRKLYSNLFVAKGDCQCTICNQSLNHFLDIQKHEKLCPACGSGKRHRRLFRLLKSEVKNGANILDFSPNNGFSYYAKKQWGNHYFSSSYDQKDIADYHLDITKIDLPANKFDWIICYHVLEHISDDSKAMKELLRVLKPNGKCIIQTPFKEGEIYEDFSITSPEERLIHFHQEDHVRIYSVEALKSRLANVGFDVEVRTFSKSDHPEETEKYGFKDEEFIIVGKKPGY